MVASERIPFYPAFAVSKNLGLRVAFVQLQCDTFECKPHLTLTRAQSRGGWDVLKGSYVVPFWVCHGFWVREHNLQPQK